MMKKFNLICISTIFLLFSGGIYANVSVTPSGASGQSLPVSQVFCGASQTTLTQLQGTSIVADQATSVPCSQDFLGFNVSSGSCIVNLSTKATIPAGCAVAVNATTVNLSPTSTFTGPAITGGGGSVNITVAPGSITGLNFPIQMYCGSTNANQSIASATSPAVSVPCSNSESVIAYYQSNSQCYSCAAPIQNNTLSGTVSPSGCGSASGTAFSLSYESSFAAVTCPAGFVPPIPAGPQQGTSIFKGLGVDYAPAHFPNDDPRNDEDESNVYFEMQQLQSAGFSTIRMYGEPAKTWIAAIKAAKKLNMNIVYQVALCESNPSNGDNCVSLTNTTYQDVETQALTQLQNVINIVGVKNFQAIVPLIIIGNEVLYTSTDPFVSNASDIVGSITKVQNILKTNNLTIPTTISLQADVWMACAAPQNTQTCTALQSIVSALPSASALAINVYPFQWMVKIGDAMSMTKAKGGPSVHSVPYYITQIQNAYPGHNIMISESGWATQGLFHDGLNNATGSLANAEIYYPALYAFAKQYNIPLLAFMAFNTPTKDLSNQQMTSENHYGVFTDECNVSGAKDPKSTKLLPNTNYSGTPACSTAQSLFTFSGAAVQPPFWIQVQRGDQKFTVSVPTINNRGSAAVEAITPWPTLTLQVGDQVTITNKNPAQQDPSAINCISSVATVNTTGVNAHRGGTWTSISSPPGCTGINWSSITAPQNISLPVTFGSSSTTLWPGVNAVGTASTAEISVNFSGPAQSTIQVNNGDTLTIQTNCSGGGSGTITCAATYSGSTFTPSVNNPANCSAITWNSNDGNNVSFGIPVCP